LDFYGIYINNNSVKFYINSQEVQSGSIGSLGNPEISIENSVWLADNGKPATALNIKSVVDSIKFIEGDNFISDLYNGGRVPKTFNVPVLQGLIKDYHSRSIPGQQMFEALNVCLKAVR
jgi:hypothetical protein